jgi:hypothetical protein
MVEAAARRSRLIADAGRSEKERDAEGGGESGEGSSAVLYIVPRGGRSGGLGALACMGQLTRTPIANFLCARKSNVASFARVRMTTGLKSVKRIASLTSKALEMWILSLVSR